MSNAEYVRQLIEKADKANIWSKQPDTNAMWSALGNQYIISVWPDDVYMYHNCCRIAYLNRRNINYQAYLHMFITQPSKFIVYMHNKHVDKYLDKLD